MTTLSTDDLNDFITLAPECVKPVEFRKSRADTSAIEIGPDGTLQEDNAPLPVAQISLTDCLACSGCITSSEAVLIDQQSVKQLTGYVRKYRDNYEHVFAVSVAPQVRVSLAHGFGISVEQVDDRLRQLFLNHLGFKYIVGTEIGRAIALEESVIEAGNRLGPIISSVCPGWTCYAEKSKPEIVPMLSNVRSPQQITGNLIKRLAAEANSRCETTAVYHVSIMPCFDKKLEAARPEYTMNGKDDGEREVDLVLTPREILDLCREEGLDFADLATRPYSVDDAPPSWPARDSWFSNVGSSAGGYLQHIISRVQSQTPNSTIEVVNGRNRDVVQYSVVGPNGIVAFRGAQIYGFRNIQNTVRKLKPQKGSVTRRAKVQSLAEPRDWHYIEMMACPGGCGSGGGQLPINIGGSTADASPASVPNLQAEYDSLPSVNVTPQLVDTYVSTMGVTVTPSLVNGTFRPAVENVEAQPLALSTQW